MSYLNKRTRSIEIYRDLSSRDRYPVGRCAGKNIIRRTISWLVSPITQNYAGLRRQKTRVKALLNNTSPSVRVTLSLIYLLTVYNWTSPCHTDQTHVPNDHTHCKHNIFSSMNDSFIIFPHRTTLFWVCHEPPVGRPYPGMTDRSSMIPTANKQHKLPFPLPKTTGIVPVIEITTLCGEITGYRHKLLQVF